MLKMMLRGSNVIIFDQPLDHLDSESIDAVIEAINNINPLQFLQHIIEF